MKYKATFLRRAVIEIEADDIVEAANVAKRAITNNTLGDYKLLSIHIADHPEVSRPLYDYLAAVPVGVPVPGDHPMWKDHHPFIEKFK